MSEVITSSANARVKHLRALQEKNQLRRQEKIIIVEGAKEIARAQTAGLKLTEIFVCPDMAEKNFVTAPTATLISREVFAKIAYRDSRDGVVGIFSEPSRQLSDLKLSANPFFIIVEGVEKPGNLGAIIRTADGAGANAVIVTDERCDIWNPNVIRASVGTIFTTQVVVGDKTVVADFLTDHRVNAFAAELTDNARNYTELDFTQPSAIIVGTEATAVSDFWLQRAQAIKLPMHGVNSSLNVSNAAAILLYEIVRQRAAKL